MNQKVIHTEIQEEHEGTTIEMEMGFMGNYFY